MGTGQACCSSPSESILIDFFDHSREVDGFDSLHDLFDDEHDNVCRPALYVED